MTDSPELSDPTGGGSAAGPGVGSGTGVGVGVGVGVDNAHPANADAALLTDPDLYRSGDPFEVYARLRRLSPVAWHEPRVGRDGKSIGGFWAVTTHAEVTSIGTDPETFCSSRGILVDEIGSSYESPPTMMHTDPPQHTRYRRLVQPGFKPTLVRQMEQGVTTKARTLVDKIEPGVPFDVVPELSVPFPLQVICELLGVDGEQWPRFYQWSEAVIPGEIELTEEEKGRLQLEMWEYLIGVAEARRAEPADDLVSALATAELDGDKLSEPELAMFLIQLLVAGNETTRNLLSAGLVALAGDAKLWTLLHEARQSAADRGGGSGTGSGSSSALESADRLVASAVEELLRWTTPVISFMRTATRAVTLRGQAIAAGDPVLLVYASANRDEAVFGPDAGELSLTRHPNPHVSFGFGPHFCLGAALARLEARTMLSLLAERFSGCELAGEVERTASSVIAGVRSAPLVFTS